MPPLRSSRRAKDACVSLGDARSRHRLSGNVEACSYGLEKSLGRIARAHATERRASVASLSAVACLITTQPFHARRAVATISAAISLGGRFAVEPRSARGCAASTCAGSAPGAGCSRPAPRGLIRRKLGELDEAHHLPRRARQRTGERRPRLVDDAALEHRVGALRDASRSSTSSGTSRPKTSVGRRVSPPHSCVARERRARLRELECAHDAATVVRVHARGGLRVELPGAGRARARRRARRRTAPTARARPPAAAAAARGRTALRAGTGRFRRRRPASARARGRRRSPRGRVAGTRPPRRRARASKTPTRRAGCAGAAVSTSSPRKSCSRVGRDDLRRDPIGDRLGDRGLAARGRPEDREDRSQPRSRSRTSRRSSSRQRRRAEVRLDAAVSPLELLEHADIDSAGVAAIAADPLALGLRRRPRRATPRAAAAAAPR